MKTKLILAFLLLVSSFLLLPSACPQGSLTPPGAPAPTMKTLDQVEPRIIINATNTPGDADSVFKITQPGSYYLTDNIAGIAGKSGIEIAASSVTLDLNGFQLTGVAGSLSGVSTSVTGNNVTVRNGVVTGFGQQGVSINIAYSRIENIHSSENGG